jgi:hypothetical protein
MELRFVAKESDYLLLESEDGVSHRVLIDDSLRDAVRNTQEIVSSGIVPKDVQQRLRSGSTVAEVAAHFGVTESAIDPFAAPILDEIRYVIQSALSTLVSDGQSMSTLQEVVLRTQPETKFAAHRGDSGWVVTGNGAHSYTWKFDPRSKVLEPISESAQKLASLNGAREVVTQTVPVRSAQPVATEQPAPQTETPTAAVHDLVQELRSRREKSEELRPSSAKGRASLPSWDEIVSGAHLDTED